MQDDESMTAAMLSADWLPSQGEATRVRDQVFRPPSAASVQNETTGVFKRLFGRWRRNDTPGFLPEPVWAEVKTFKKYWKRSHLADAMEASWSPDARCPDAQNLYDPGSYAFGENGYVCRCFTRRSRHHVPPLSLATIRTPYGGKTVITGRPGGNYLLPSSKVVAVASCKPVTNQQVLKDFLLKFIDRLNKGPHQPITRAIIDKQWQERTQEDGGRMYVLMQVQNSTPDLDFSAHKGYKTPQEAVYECEPRYYCHTYVKGYEADPPFPFLIDEGAESFLRSVKKGTFFNPKQTIPSKAIVSLWTVDRDDDQILIAIQNKLRCSAEEAKDKLKAYRAERDAIYAFNPRKIIEEAREYSDIPEKYRPDFDVDESQFEDVKMVKERRNLVIAGAEHAKSTREINFKERWKDIIDVVKAKKTLTKPRNGPRPVKVKRFENREAAWVELMAGDRMLLVVKLSHDDESETWFTTVKAALQHALKA